MGYILVVVVVKERLEFNRREIVGTVEGGNVLAEGEFILVRRHCVFVVC
jgi:hypothetical protein